MITAHTLPGRRIKRIIRRVRPAKHVGCIVSAVVEGMWRLEGLQDNLGHVG